MKSIDIVKDEGKNNNDNQENKHNLLFGVCRHKTKSEDRCINFMFMLSALSVLNND